MFGLDFNDIITIGKALLSIAGIAYSIYSLFA